MGKKRNKIKKGRRHMYYYGEAKFKNDEQKQQLISANKDMVEFLTYVKDGYLEADFTIKEGHLVLKNTTRGRAEYIARRYFGVEPAHVKKTEDESTDTNNCSDCFYYDKRSASTHCSGDFCNHLKCYMHTLITCKHFKLKAAV